MTQYVDASALVKRYVEESNSDAAQQLILRDPELVTGNHSFVEVVRALYRSLAETAYADAREVFERDWRRLLIVRLDETLCRRAATLATVTGSRTLDAFHLAAAERAGGRSIDFLTFDLRQAAAARSLGYTVVGV